MANYYRPVTRTPFDHSSAATYEESLRYDVGSTSGPSPRYSENFRDSEHTVHPVRAPPHLSSYPEYNHNGRRNAATNISHPQRPEPEAWRNVDNNSVDPQDSLWPPHNLYDEANGHPAAFAQANGYNSQNTPSYSCPAAGVSHPGQYTGYYDPHSNPADNCEPNGMTAAIPSSAAYRSRVASPKVVEASHNRRKEGVNLFPCEECGATLTSHQNLRYHLNAHYNIKPFPCDHCQKSFGTAHDRNRHAKICAEKNQNGIRFFHSGHLASV